MGRSLRRALTVATVLIATLVPAGEPAHPAGAVDLALVLAIDCSYSVDEHEFALQMQGFAEAFRSPEIIEAIRSGPNGRIAVAMIQWSGAGAQTIAVPWLEIGDEAGGQALAQIFEETPRLTLGPTSISGAVHAGIALLRSSPFAGARGVIDVSSDGINNSGAAPDALRARALAYGITINALAIQTEIPYLELYFRNHVIAGHGSFVLVAEDYEAFHDAIKKKLLKEIMRPIS